MRVTAVLTVRNEGAFLLEWFAHHRACGFTDFLVFSNDCSDGTDSMLDRLEALGWLTHQRNDGPHTEGPQWAALKQADKHPLVQDADWVMPIDIDEFVNIHVGDRTLPALLAALPEATAIPLTWRFFGNAGVVEYDDRPITETFTRTAPAELHWPWRAALFKTLFRNDGSYGKLGVHRPRNPDRDRMAAQRWFDGSGRRLHAMFHTTRIFTETGRDSHQLVQLNHYALGAMESYVVKCDRGSVFPGVTSLKMDYWVDRNFSDIEDRSILGLSSADLRNALHADPVLGPLHQSAVAWRHDRFRGLMAEEAWRALYGRLLMTPPTRVLSRAEAETIWRRFPATSNVKG
ncbi:MAG: glycosyl transferase family 2 [Rhodobacter sp.]|nr:glycosyl transferase family 2 [Rhodobacter sp.]